MFVNDNLIFIELHKTGTSTIAKLIDSVLPGETVRDKYGHKHMRLEDSAAGRVVVGSVRNPFDWYVSLWAYGCAGKGTLHWQLTASFGRFTAAMLKRSVVMPHEAVSSFRQLGLAWGRDPAFWRRVYSDPYDPSLFREWLTAIMSVSGKRQMTEGYAFSPLRSAVGFYSYRFLYLFTGYQAWDAEVAELSSYDAIRGFYERQGIVQAFVRTEHINVDLAVLMLELGKDPGLIASVEKRANRSRHRQTADYYDAETQALVRTQDQLIFELFDYTYM
jgi:hypothetical protein